MTKNEMTLSERTLKKEISYLLQKYKLYSKVERVVSVFEVIRDFKKLEEG